MNHTTHHWYIRQPDGITGPFTGSVIRNQLILGRLTLSDETSTDKRNWLPLSMHPELHPDGGDSEQIARTQRFQDERDGFDRRQQSSASQVEKEQRKSAERRSEEEKATIQRRQLRTLLMQKYRHRREKIFWPMLGTFLLLCIVALLAFFYPSTLPVPLANCATAAGPNINWNNCLKVNIDLHGTDLSHARLRNTQLAGSNLLSTDLRYADLAYADLHFTDLSYSDMLGVSLIGANLRHANLSYTDLTNADLSYADLSDANLGGSKLQNTRFDHAIWTNGQLCAVGSVGQCIPTP